MGGLAAVVREELGGVEKRAVLLLGGMFEDRDLSRGEIYVTEAVAGGRKSKDVVHRRKVKIDASHQFGGQEFEQHGGG